MEKTARKTLLLLDTHAILHRAYHALPDFTTSGGEPTGALYGLSTLLLKIIKELHPEYIIACYDLPDTTFRKEVFVDYKAGRAKTEDALIAQIERSRDVFEALSIPVYSAKGFEADDVIATLSSLAKKHEDLDVVIASGDMDTMQLVDGSRVRVYTLRKGINDTVIYDEKEVKKRFGFGPELLTDYKGLRGDPSDNIPGIKGIGEVTAQKLITTFGTIENIYSELEKGDAKFIKIGIKGKTLERIKGGKDEAVFSKMLATVRRDIPIELDLDKASWKANGNVEKLRKLFESLEFRSLVLRADDWFSKGVTKEELVSSEPVEPVDQALFKRAQIALWVLDSSFTNPDVADILKEARTKDLSEAVSVLEEKLKKDGLFSVYEKIELPLVPILERSENRGIKIDKNYLANLGEEYKQRQSKLESSIHEHAGLVFNINSPKQLGEVIFTRLTLGGRKIKKTPGGAVSTRAGELDKLRGTHPIIDAVLEYREIQKLITTYIDPILSLIDKNNRLHAHFVQTGTETGRFSSQNPNVQNIPTRTDVGRAIKNAFIASDGYRLVSFDYSQIELRVLAALSGDKDLIAVFNDGGDVHSRVASKVFGVIEKDVTKEMRRRAKIINFGIVYGMGVNALKENLGTSRAEAEEFLNNYFKTFPGVTKYLENSENVARKNGYTETYFGRRRYFKGLRSPIPYLRAAAERAASNAPLQGTAADIIKIAMIDIARDTAKYDDGLFLLLQIHDELVFEIKDNLVSEVLPIIKQRMEGVKIPNVPIVVNVSSGDRLGELASV